MVLITIKIGMVPPTIRHPKAMELTQLHIIMLVAMDQVDKAPSNESKKWKKEIPKMKTDVKHRHLSYYIIYSRLTISSLL